MSAEPTLPSGTILGGRYSLVRLIGHGGMGSVYEATQLDLGRRVAVKTLDPRLTFDPVHIERFKREAQAAAQLGHPNIVQVTDFQWVPGQVPFLVMERLEGQSLAQRIEQRGPLDPTSVVSVATQALDALAAAHRAGIVHRDIKPDNLFLVSVPAVGELVKVLDFGIAKLADTGQAQVTATGAMLGTPAYMPPEQARGSAVDHRADIYALGATLYHALSGRLPFHATSVSALLFAIVEQTPAPLAQLRPDLPAQIVYVIERAMQKDPARRFGSAEEMRAALVGNAPIVAPISASAASVYAATIGSAPPPHTPPVLSPAAIPSAAPPAAPMTFGGVSAPPQQASAGVAIVKWLVVGLIALSAVVGLVILGLVYLKQRPTAALPAVPSAPAMPTPAAPDSVAHAGADTATPAAPSASAAPSSTHASGAGGGGGGGGGGGKNVVPKGTISPTDTRLSPVAPSTPIANTSLRMSGPISNLGGADFGGCPGCDFTPLLEKKRAIDPAVDACYAASQHETPLHEEGRTYKLVIEDDGTVSAVYLRATGVPLVPHLDACVARAWLNVKLPMKTREGGVGRVDYGAECVKGYPGHCLDGAGAPSPGPK